METESEYLVETTGRGPGSGAAKSGKGHEEGLDRLDLRVWLRLLQCSMTIEKRLRRRFIEQFDTTLPRFDVLATLEKHSEGLTLGELSRAMLVSNGNVTAMARQLEADGLIISRPDPKDRRYTIVCLSEKGQQYFAGLAEAHRKWINAMFQQTSQDDLLSLYDLLGELRRSLWAEKVEKEDNR